MTDLERALSLAEELRGVMLVLLAEDAPPARVRAFTASHRAWLAIIDARDDEERPT